MENQRGERTGTPGPFSGLSILIVEDNPEVREITEAFCQQLGFAVSSVGNAADALAHLGSGAAVDILFADVMMPGMTGDKLAAAARRLRPGLKILLATGHPDFAADSKTAVIMKPYRYAGLQRRLAALVAGNGSARGGAAPDSPT